MSSGFLTAAEMQQQLGGIPLERIRMVPPPGMATEEDALRVQDAEGRTCEVLDGVLVEKAIGFLKARIATVLVSLLDRYLEGNNLGIIVGPDGLIRLKVGRTRAPDVAFIRWERFPGGQFPTAAVPVVAPDLTVEVLSKGNTRAEIETKLDEYFSAGVTTPWVIDPVREAARIYAARDDVAEIGENGVLCAPEVLPGFQITLRDLLNRARKGASDR
jgi:Uma2 family endonuclease